MRYALIIAGGSGTRLWPMSRAGTPKQLIPLIREGDAPPRSLIQVAAGRMEGMVPPERRYVCAAERLRAAILEQLPRLGESQFLGEPVGRDTLNAVGYAAAVLAQRDPEAVFAVLTADHLIEPQEEFARAFELGFRLVEAHPDTLATFAVVPTFAATGYGWVERGEPIPGFDGAYRAATFVEKPPRPVAEQFFASGRFSWNSGMFVFAAATVMSALSRHRPATFAALRRIAEAEGEERRRLLEELYPGLERISVDHGLLEPAAKDPILRIATIPMDVRWKDVGSWPTYGETLPPDAAGNRTNARAIHLESRNVLAVSDEPAHLIATIGCEDLIVVRTAEVTLVCRASEAEKVKALVDLVPESLR